ncbi:MAG: hypothetical protein KAW12_25435 [Candidatus Aminicenantes bacterium]|nr:hypothetical protein [Candidatus Aminicenantes bacterium]
MIIKKVKLSDIKNENKFLLSYPLRPELYQNWENSFLDVPKIAVNQKNEILFGADFYHYCKIQKKPREIDAMQGDFPDKEALLLGYNLKDKFYGFNLYEKLIFVKKFKHFYFLARPADADGSRGWISEIYERTGLDIKINDELLTQLETLTGNEFLKILSADRIALKAALKLCGFTSQDRKFFFLLFARAAFSTSHQLKILELMEEIMFRDKTSCAAVFEKLNIKDCFDSRNPREIIVEKIFKYRFPEYSQKEQEWQKKIKKLKLPANVKLFHYPFFEKRQVDVHISLPDPQGINRIIKNLEQKGDRQS